MKVKIVKLAERLKDPSFAREGDVGIDLYAAKSMVIEPGKRALVPTGIKIELEEGFEAQIRPKSGLALNHGIGVLNSPGTIDSGYRGEIGVVVVNLGEKAFKVEKGKKIAQMVFNKTEKPEIEFVKELNETTRGSNGFGSTGLE